MGTVDRLGQAALAGGARMQAPELRVILVGRTGLDQSLRRDPAIELIRAATPIDALGELADPIDELSPTGPVVIVGEPGEADIRAGDEPDALALWITSLRRIEPGVRVLRVCDNGTRPDPAFDASVRTDADADAIREALALPATEPTTEPITEPADEPAAPETPTPDAAEPEDALEPTTPATATEIEAKSETATVDRSAIDPAAAHDSVFNAAALAGDAPVVAALLEGRSVIEPALELLRRRLNRRDLELVPSDANEDSHGNADATTNTDTRSTPVAWRGRVFGVLRCDDGRPALDASSLDAAARWLASWLRLEEQQRELRRAAFTDPLTGAWNRRYFDRYLQSAIAQARPRRGSVTVLVFDIDDFKRYNDRYGHAAGDDILCEAVKLISGAIRPDDRVCRIGGDEFAVIFPDAPREPGSRPPETIFQISRRFQRAISDHRFPKLGEQAPGTLTISGGLATYPWDGATAQELLDRADRLALESKRLGKNAITFGPGAARAAGPASDAPGDAGDAGLNPTED